MIEIRGDKKVLVTPVSAEDLADIKIGDIVWLDGDLMTCRDVAHRRLVEYGRELPYDVRNKAIFHAGPIVRKKEGTEDEYEMVSVGPTTSMRMEKFEYELSLERAAWDQILSAPARNLVQSTVYFRLDVLLSLQLRLSVLQSITGMSLECLRHFGAAR